MKLTHYYQAWHGEIELTVEFEIEDQGIGDWECHGAHGKDIQLVPVIQDIKTDDKYFSHRLRDQDFYNHVCEEIENEQSFFDQADAICNGNEYE
ncbi:MAG TPA: hypothetical protein VMW66_00575 [Elusimicrobiales bacterium]|nr:hypothetical protein [Elusimicrobiales bacterium]